MGNSPNSRNRGNARLSRDSVDGGSFKRIDCTLLNKYTDTLHQLETSKAKQTTKIKQFDPSALKSDIIAYMEKNTSAESRKDCYGEAVSEFLQRLEEEKFTEGLNHVMHHFFQTDDLPSNERVHRAIYQALSVKGTLFDKLFRLFDLMLSLEFSPALQALLEETLQQEIIPKVLTHRSLTESELSLLSPGSFVSVLHPGQVVLFSPLCHTIPWTDHRSQGDIPMHPQGHRGVSEQADCQSDFHHIIHETTHNLLPHLHRSPRRTDRVLKGRY